MNDLSDMTFDSIEIDGPGYTIAGDAITLTAPRESSRPTAQACRLSASIQTWFRETSTVASGGELDIDGVITGSNGFSLSGGGILGGTGQVTALTVQGSEVQPGILGVGNLSVEGGATLYPNSTFSISINSSGRQYFACGVWRAEVARRTARSPALNVVDRPGIQPGARKCIHDHPGQRLRQFNGLPEGAYVTSRRRDDVSHQLPSGRGLDRCRADDGSDKCLERELRRASSARV